MNATDINEVSIKTRYPDLSFDTDGIILEGLVQKIDIYDNSCSFGNCSFQSMYEVVHAAAQSGAALQARRSGP